MSYASTKETMSDAPPNHIRRLARLLIEAAAHPGFALSRAPLTGNLIAAMVPTKRPPILLISLPRAGSSWIGRILGASDGALYLREPMNQSNLERVGREAATSFFELGVCRDREAYQRFADLTFRGIPRFKQTIAQFPAQWGIATRGRKRIVVKEVNPLVVEHLWERYRPRIIFLLRHPLPVVRSFDALGWTGDKFRTAFLPETLAALEEDYVLPKTSDLWEQGGAFQAIIHNRVMAFLRKVDHAILRYEDVCEDPIREFTRIFDFCDLPFTAAVRDEVVRSSHTEKEYVPGAYDTVRDSVHMKDRWKHEVDPARIERLRRNYFANRPIFYTDERDW